MSLIKVGIMEGWMKLPKKSNSFQTFVVNEMAYGVTCEKTD